jgi:hypothetical protein
MHLLVTDRLACVRCGPGFPLVLLADELRDRRVLQGSLGCANCRERYPVEGGFGDFRLPVPEGDGALAPVEGDDPEGALRTAALLGVQQGPGLLLLAGRPVRHAERVAAMIEGIEVVAAHPGLRGLPEIAGVSRIAMGPRFPFQTGTLQGVALSGEGGRRDLTEAVRVLARGARLVLMTPPQGSAGAMEEAGLELLLEAETAVVGARK